MSSSRLALSSLVESTALVFSCPLIPSVGIDGDPWMERKHIQIDYLLIDSRGHISVLKYLTLKNGGYDIDSYSWSHNGGKKIGNRKTRKREI
jgi:hypothetical protein